MLLMGGPFQGRVYLVPGAVNLVNRILLLLKTIYWGYNYLPGIVPQVFYIALISVLFSPYDPLELLLTSTFVDGETEAKASWDTCPT